MNIYEYMKFDIYEFSGFDSIDDFETDVWTYKTHTGDLRRHLP